MIAYEWVVETVDADDDIVDVHHSDTLVAALVAAAATQAPQDRQWAYLNQDGRLPAVFDGGAPVPARFRLSAKLTKLPKG